MTNSDTGARLLSAVARLNRWATKNADLPLPSAQARLLALVEQLGQGRIGELAELDHCSQPTMTTQVQRLERAGLVERKPDPNDRRASLVQLTPTGKKTLTDVRAARSRTLAAVLDRFEDRQHDDVERAIATLEGLLKQAENG